MSVTKEFWKEMVVYQIWPRSFCDGNGDGIGDLKGIYDKLDYIRSLGVDAIWLSPVYVSPQKDYGYDVADYRNIAPEYGTMADFDAVLQKAHAIGLRVIMDLVINHTSDQHEWFQKSRKGIEPYKDYYIWRKGRGKKEKRPPNNWTSMFSGPGWSYDEVRGEYYLHLFCKEQPDLNMDNPKVREEIKGILRFWLDKGVDGFREDVITLISKREGLPNGFPLMPAARGMRHYVNGPNIHDYLREFRSVVNRYEAVTIGEAPLLRPKQALRYVSGEERELDMMFHFQHMECDCLMYSWIAGKFNLRKLKRVYADWQRTLYGKGWNALYIENHDQPRIISRYGSEKYRVKSGKCLATMYMTQGGTPFIYQGQEIGMLNMPLPNLEDYPDVSTHANYNLFKKFGLSHEKLMEMAHRAARDNARTPMQWDKSPSAGFTAGTPWFKVNDNYTEINVSDAIKDENSILNYYKKLIALRKKYPVFIYGDFRLLYPRSKTLFVFERRYEKQTLFVCMNFSEKETAFVLPERITEGNAELLLSNDFVPSGTKTTVLRPYEARVYLLSAEKE